MITRKQTVKKYTVTAGVLTYNIPFPIYESGDVLAVWSADENGLDEYTLTLGSDYGVTINSAGDGGTVTLKPDRVPIGATLAIVSNIPETQELDLSHTAEVDTESTEKELDRQVQMIQQLSDKIARCIKVNITDSRTPDDYMRDFWEAVAAVLKALGIVEDAHEYVQKFVAGIPILKPNLSEVENSGVDGLFWVPGFGDCGDRGDDISNRVVVADGTRKPRPLGERFADIVNVKDFGAVGDFDPVTKTGTDNQAAIQSAIEFCAAHGKKLRITSGLYGVWNNGATRTIDKTSSVYNGMKSGGLDLCDGSVIEWDDDAWLIQMFPTATGSFLANSNTGIFHPDSADYKSSNITLIQPQIDGSYLELWNTSYADLDSEYCNENAIAFTAHSKELDASRNPARNIKIEGGHIRGYLAMRRGTGGKGIALEEGVENFLCCNTIIEDCTFATSVIYRQSSPIYPAYARSIVFDGIEARRCGEAFFCLGRGYDGEILDEVSVNPADASIIWKGSAWCCGHHPDFFDASVNKKEKRKCAPVVLAGCANVDVEITANNPNGFPSTAFPAGGTRFPSSYPSEELGFNWEFYGTGLSGDVGAVVAGWGKNCTIKAIAHGNFDSAWQIAQPYTIAFDEIHGGAFDANQLNFDIALDSCSTCVNNNIDPSSSITGIFKFTCPNISNDILLTPHIDYFKNCFFVVRMVKNDEWIEFFGTPKKISLDSYPWKYAGLSKSLTQDMAMRSLYAQNLYVRSLHPNSVEENTALNVNMEITSHRIKPFSDDTYNIGEASLRWDNIFATSGIINTSDKREKQDIDALSEAILKAWGNIQFRQFLFCNAVKEKGDAARVHVGIIAQQIVEAFASEGLDATHYGLLCYDEWPDEYENVTVVDVEATYDKDGNKLTPEQTHEERRLVRASGNRYGIRYSEALCLEAAYQRRELERLKARIESLELQVR